MLTQTLENELLTDLSDQQQQIIIGGLQSLKKAVGTLFQNSNVLLLNQVGSGPGGSFVNTSLQDKELSTAANETLKAVFGGVPVVY